MKTKEIPINTDQDVELTIIPEYQSTPFVITGEAEAVLPIADDIQALEAMPIPRTSKLASAAVKASTQAPEQPQAVYIEPSRTAKLRQWFADSHVRQFDKAHGTSLYAELQAKRRKTAVFLKASELHLFDSDSDYYKSQLRRMVKADR